MGNHGTSTSKTNKGKKSDRKHSGQSSKGESSTKSTSQTAAPQQTTPQQASGYTSDPNAGFFDYQQAQYYQDPYGQVQQGGGTDAYATTDEQYGWRQHTECIAKWSCCQCSFGNMTIKTTPACVNFTGCGGHPRCSNCGTYWEYV